MIRRGLGQSYSGGFLPNAQVILLHRAPMNMETTTTTKDCQQGTLMQQLQNAMPQRRRRPTLFPQSINLARQDQSSQIQFPPEIFRSIQTTARSLLLSPIKQTFTPNPATSSRRVATTCARRSLSRTTMLTASPATPNTRSGLGMPLQRLPRQHAWGAATPASVA